ncbi:methionine ABC transporter ATP-binding protein [Muricomes intestini]|jgi:D-methionine transport system ATP-binding protein|uniref:D-methionine transport system ATP-binding protein n=1 Tax=Muricomes intestini TaxID=1796634 RepID=A0A4R3K917_9FIRM|nr:ATP-binding cassette domain-containing protein [Muricomes intestini]TCS79516.1 D-methionine transport system ATP-binding protein [Muricomes intestini]HAX53467.1 ABC transporter [Lachnospiraceae bacterium]HCR84135.1 ABC transporter [Lachnospiraceae bacterium]
MESSEPIIKLVGLGKEFQTANGPIKALDDINLSIEEGEIFGIIGLSGAGKSTLVRCINYLEIPTSGDVFFENESLAAMSPKEQRMARQAMGMIFQQFNLLDQRNVLQNVCFPLEIAKWPRKKAVNRAKDLLKVVGLEDRAKAYPAQLSGGQKQRVAIARALATNPKILLCDEATSALDPNTTKSILDLLKEINKSMGVTVVVITHEMSVIEAICDRVAIIDQSHIAEVGSVAEIFSEPKSKIGRQLILGDAAEQVSRFGGSRQVRISFDGRSSFEPVLANLILACKVPVNIMHAETRDIHGTAMGQMVIQLPEDETEQNRVLNYLKTAKISHEEVKDYDI